MHPAPGLATSLAMQAYLRHHGTPVCLHELLVKTVRQQGQRARTGPTGPTPPSAGVASAAAPPAR
ncbi:Uncharacterised protein [Xylophilus ampelinus]|nr:hypothetical protein [Variovorax sp.]VTY38927.1 Uncharacterised protein [Xylophilus ampelinus]